MEDKRKEFKFDNLSIVLKKSLSLKGTNLQDNLEYYLNAQEFTKSYNYHKLIESNSIAKIIVCFDDNSNTEQHFIFLLKPTNTLMIQFDPATQKIMDYHNFSMKFKDLKLQNVACCTFNNIIYFFQFSEVGPVVYVIEHKRKKHYEVLNLGFNISFLHSTSYAFFDTKLYFFGGIDKSGKVINELHSFDISNYSFVLEKVKNNVIEKRIKAGTIAIINYIYVIGGLSSNLGEEGKILEDVKLMKIDVMMNGWMDFPVEGDLPKYQVDPDLKFLFDRYLVSVSSFHGLNVYVLDLMKKVGKNLTTSSNILKALPVYDRIYFYRRKMQVVSFKDEEEDIAYYEINMINS